MGRQGGSGRAGSIHRPPSETHTAATTAAGEQRKGAGKDPPNTAPRNATAAPAPARELVKASRQASKAATAKARRHAKGGGRRAGGRDRRIRKQGSGEREAGTGGIVNTGRVWRGKEQTVQLQSGNQQPKAGPLRRHTHPTRKQGSDREQRQASHTQNRAEGHYWGPGSRPEGLQGI